MKLCSQDGQECARMVTPCGNENVVRGRVLSKDGNSIWDPHITTCPFLFTEASSAPVAMIALAWKSVAIHGDNNLALVQSKIAWGATVSLALGM